MTSTMTHEEWQSYIDAFATQCQVADDNGDCTHVAFPQVNNEATDLVAQAILSAIAEIMQSPSATQEAIIDAAHHGMVAMAAWGYGLGALDTAASESVSDVPGCGTPESELTSDSDPAVAEWHETLRQAGDADWGF